MGNEAPQKTSQWKMDTISLIPGWKCLVFFFSLGLSGPEEMKRCCQLGFLRAPDLSGGMNVSVLALPQSPPVNTAGPGLP